MHLAMVVSQFSIWAKMLPRLSARVGSMNLVHSSAVMESSLQSSNSQTIILKEKDAGIFQHLFCCSPYRFILAKYHGCGITCRRYSAYALIWQCYIWFHHRPYGLKCSIQCQITTSICLIWYCPRKFNQILQWWYNFNDLLPNFKNLFYYFLSLLAEFSHEHVHEIFQNLIKNNW